MIDKLQIISRIKQAKNFQSDIELADFLGVSRATLSNWKARNRVDYDLLFSKCEHINLHWLITGEGSMFAGNVEHHNAAAIDHSTATVIHSEAPAANTDYDGLITSQQQTIERLTKIIDNLTSK